MENINCKPEAVSEPVRHSAVFLLNNEYPELKRATIVISDTGDNVTIGVKAVGRVFENTDEGISVHERQFGDVCIVSKTEPISNLFENIKGLFISVSDLIKAFSDVEA